MKSRAGAPQSAPPLELLEAALAARASLLADPRTTACRLFHGHADGIAGLVIEKLGHALVVQLHEGCLTLHEAAARQLCVAALQQLNLQAAYCKVFPKERSSALGRLAQRHSDPTPWIGVPVAAEFPVLENGMRLLVRPYDGYATGLFLEHRANRRRLGALARGRRVLNAFAYTCGFTVAAALAGAAATVSVDVSNKSLEWGRRNLRANGLPLDEHTMIRADIFDYCRRARRQGRTFDLIILDPPTFARSRRPRRVFALAEDLDRLAAESLGLLAPGGVLFLSTNHRGTARQRLEQAARRAATRQGRSCQVLVRPRLPLDFRGDPDYAKSVLLRVS